jgi:hypothetical protein
MSSSNRQAEPCDAVVYRGDQPVGPLRLPSKDAASFIERFNRLYGAAGMELESTRAATDNAGDHEGNPPRLPPDGA